MTHNEAIRAALRLSLGSTRTPYREAAALSGIKQRSLYNMTEGKTLDLEAHLPDLLAIPDFAARYLLDAHGYVVIPPTEEAVCIRESFSEVQLSVGLIGVIDSDGIITRTEKIRWRERCLIMFRRVGAVFHKRERAEV